MHPDLESVLAGDEDGRARVRATESDAAALLEREKAEADGRRAARREVLLAELEREVESIRHEAEREAAARAAAHERRREERGQAAAAAFARAVEAFVQVVGPRGTAP